MPTHFFNLFLIFDQVISTEPSCQTIISHCHFLSVKTFQPQLYLGLQSVLLLFERRKCLERDNQTVRREAKLSFGFLEELFSFSYLITKYANELHSSAKFRF